MSSGDRHIHSKEIYKRKTGFIGFFSRKKKRFLLIVKMKATKSIASPGATTRVLTSGRGTERAPGR
jgi:hypothetical protein